ncbi:hypothetical protein K439DRAFT_1388960 [Ramaria rubella]|nr:hypothetical protein K439DRAFT_1388960 [Ramaria rubella]
MADGHCGQALGLSFRNITYAVRIMSYSLGLGLYCQNICVNMAGYCSIEWNKALHALTPYKHLA